MFYNVRRTENKDVLMLHRKGEAGRGGEVVVMGRRGKRRGWKKEGAGGEGRCRRRKVWGRKGRCLDEE